MMLSPNNSIITDARAKLEAQLVKLREDMVEGFKRHYEILARHEAELVKLREDMVAGFRRHDEEIARLRADMMEGFNLLRRHLEALGARMTPYADDKALEAASKFKIEIYTKV